MDKARKVELLKSLVEMLCMERDADVPRTEDAEELWAYFRALVNTRPPWPTDAGFLAAQDELLQGVIVETLSCDCGAAISPRLKWTPL